MTRPTKVQTAHLLAQHAVAVNGSAAQHVVVANVLKALLSGASLLPFNGEPVG